MPFPFTFTFPVPGLYNPFSADNVKGPATHMPGMSPTPPPTASFRQSPVKRRRDLLQSQIYSSSSGSPSRTSSQSSLNHWDHLRRPSPAAPPLLDNQSQSTLLGLASRKRARGWEPTLPEQSRSRETFAQSKGWLDTPAKYKDMADDGYVGVQRGREDRDNDEEVDVAQPAAKRRRGLAGSIISTALSAALIGSAVGLTVYRLWRDRGKESDPTQAQQHHEREESPEAEEPLASPPPPYSQHDASMSSSTKQYLPPTTPSRKRSQRHAYPVSAGKRTGAHRRNARSSRAPYGTAAPQPATSSSAQMFAPVQPEFNFGQPAPAPATAPVTFFSASTSSAIQPTTYDPAPMAVDKVPGEEPDVEEQMDWLGDKLSSLIEQGKRALRSEVVVSSDSQDDLVDDGSGAWEDQEPSISNPGPSVSRNGSMKRVLRRNRSQTAISITPPSRKQAFANNITSAPIGGTPGFLPPSSWGHNRTYSAEAPIIFQQSTPNLHQYQAPAQHQRGRSIDGGMYGTFGPAVSTPNTSISAEFGLGESYESPELKETMRRAREKMMAMRAGRS